MKKYKQTFIPSVSTVGFNNTTSYIREYYTKHLQGKSVVNKHLRIRIYFTSLGKGKLAFGGGRYIKRAILMLCLPKLLEVAEFNNFGQRKEKDSMAVLGYLNFKAKVRIDNKIENIRIAVMVKTDGKVYYSHDINIKK